MLRSAEDRRELIKRFKASGQSQTEFCRENKVNLGTFCHWLHDSPRKARPGKNPTQRVKFAEVQVAPGLAAPIEIRLPSGISIRLRDAGVVGDLVKFVREAASC